MATKKAAPAVEPKKNIGALVDEMFALREAKRALEVQVAGIEKDYAVLEEQLMSKLDAEGTDKAAGKKATVSITSTVVGNVTDWDAFGAYIIKNKYLHLLQRRVSDPAARELFELKGKIPGCEPFTKRRLNLRVA